MRLPGYNYNMPGCYFITICTRERRNLLCQITDADLLEGPEIRFSAHGKIAQKQLEEMAAFYDGIRLAKYVIMPNHIHLILQVTECGSGPSGRPVPTDTKISRFVGTFKRLCNRQYGYNIWQNRSHDHVIRGEKDFQRIWEYIENNPAKWAEDCFYTEEM